MRAISCFVASILAVLPPLAASPRRARADEPSYLAYWSDGNVTTSATPLEWIAQERNPALGGKHPLTEANALRQLRHAAAARQPYLGSRIEFIGGDRLTGRIIEYLDEATDGISRPACLVVEPILAPDEPAADVPPRIRVPIERIRRVVWEERTPRTFRPNVLYFRDGREASFRALQWSDGVVRLLVEKIEQIPWDEIAEIHVAERDAWEQWADQLAVLLPGGEGLLVRFETTGGLRLTTSLERLRATGDVAKPDSQLFLVKPAWSLDPLTIPHRLLLRQSFFPPHEAPLSDCEPSAYVHRAALAGGWKQWRADANVQGDPLTAAGREFGWGFGVHAHAELQFDVPLWARGFRSRMALDRAAGDGGCVKARVYFGSNQQAGGVQGKPAFESAAIVGSTTIHDTGRVELRPVAGRPNRLVLVSDALPFERPAQSDPLDVRDVFDWLEPTLEFDPALVKAAVAKHAASMVVREHGWVVGGPYAVNWKLVNHGYANDWRTVIDVLKRPLSISLSLKIPADADALVVRAASTRDGAGPANVKLLIAGQAPSAEVSVPISGDPKNPPTLKLPIPPAARGGKEVRCELQFQSANDGLQIDLRGISFGRVPTGK